MEKFEWLSDKERAMLEQSKEGRHAVEINDFFQKSPLVGTYVMYKIQTDTLNAEIADNPISIKSTIKDFERLMPYLKEAGKLTLAMIEIFEKMNPEEKVKASLVTKGIKDSKQKALPSAESFNGKKNPASKDEAFVSEES